MVQLAQLPFFEESTMNNKLIWILIVMLVLGWGNSLLIDRDVVDVLKSQCDINQEILKEINKLTKRVEELETEQHETKT